MSKHYLIFDPIDFRGGSKVAIEAIFEDLPGSTKEVEVLTNDTHSWNTDTYVKHSFWLPSWLVPKMHGLPYLLKHLIYCVSILGVLLRNRDIRIMVATSGPGIDMGMYFAKWMLSPFKKFRFIQFIQGPVAESNLSARCLASANKVFYLPNTRVDLDILQLKRGIKTDVENDPKFEIMCNGLASSAWPSTCKHNSVRTLWAASNLKWKGLDLWIETLQRLNVPDIQVESDICYINAENQGMEVSTTNVEIPGVEWHEMPDNLDEIRQNNSIFISTSHMEPFGLSILEALAAGLCVVIPRDGAYWDKKLTDGVNCLKYLPGNSDSLSQQLQHLMDKPDQIALIGFRGRVIADKYRASRRYNNIHKHLSGGVSHAA